MARCKRCAAGVPHEFDDGATVTEVQTIVKGVGPKLAADWREKKSIGVPADAVSLTPAPLFKDRPTPPFKDRPAPPKADDNLTVVSEHTRKKAGAKRYLHIEVGPRVLKRWGKVAKSRNSTVEKIALDLLRREFDQ